MISYPFRIFNELMEHIQIDNKEICANMIERNGELVLTHGVYGPSPGAGRGSCSVKYYTEIIFHTHPKKLYSIPSVEDIVKVTKHKIIKTSVIATYWGIFQIIKVNPTIVLEENSQNQIKQIIDEININTVNPKYLEARKTSEGRRKGLNKNLSWEQINQDLFYGKLEEINSILEDVYLKFTPYPSNFIVEIVVQKNEKRRRV